MGKKAEKRTMHQDFAFATDAELNTHIARFAAAHEAAYHEILAMDARRPLGPNKVRVTFRILDKKGKG